jgi:hypothetical protein
MSIDRLLSLADFEKKRPGRKMLIWLGPGWPLFNGPNTLRLGKKEEQGLFDTIVKVSAALREAQISLYSVNPGNDFYKNFRTAPRSSHGVVPGDLVLQVFAEQSGGVVMRNGPDAAAKVANCLLDAADGPDERHTLDVKMGTKGQTARTRTVYYAQP